jgi:isopenicillin N synthase-like dioxygenase
LPALHPLQRASLDLFEASRAFFALPVSEKEVWKTKLGSEEGWSRIEGEKEFITLRTVEGTPEVLKSAARAYWNAAGGLLDQALGRISGGLGLGEGEEEGLRRYVGPCKTFQEKSGEKTATMLRLFRYEGDERKVVAERELPISISGSLVHAATGCSVILLRREVRVAR